MTQVEQAAKPERLSLEELREVWPVLSPEERVEGFRALTPDDAEEFFLALSTRGQAIILLGNARGWIHHNDVGAGANQETIATSSIAIVWGTLPCAQVES